jgi:hypothetical protein
MWEFPLLGQGSIPIRKLFPLPTFQARLSPTTGNEEIIAFQIIEPFVEALSGFLIQSSIVSWEMYFCAITSVHRLVSEMSLQHSFAARAFEKRKVFLSPQAKLCCPTLTRAVYTFLSIMTR